MDLIKKQLNITFLGTGTSQGIPMIASNDPVCLSKDMKDNRLRSSIFISCGDFSFTVDCGLDFRQQMLRANCSKIDGILLTHEHNDHTAGIDDVRPFYFKQGAISFFAQKQVFKNLHQRFSYIFETENKYPGAPSVNEHYIDGNPFAIGDLKVDPIDGLHNTLQVYGYRFDKFAYLTDMKTVSDTEIKKLHNLEVLVINALREEPHVSHFNLEEALEFISKVNPKRAYLTHISHYMGFHDEVQQKLPENVYLAYDNLQITI